MRNLNEIIREYCNDSEGHTFRDFVNDWMWVVEYAKKYRLTVLLYTVLGIVDSTCGVALVYVASRMINIVVERNLSRLPVAIGVTLGIVAFSLIISSLKKRLETRIELNLVRDIQSDLFSNIVEIQWAELRQLKSGELLSRFNKDMETVMENAITWIPKVIINIYTFLIIIVMLFRMDPVIALIGLSSAPFLFFMSRYILRKQKGYKRQMLELDADMMGFETESFYNMDAIKAYGVRDSLFTRLRGYQARYKELHENFNLFQIKSNVAVTLLGTVVSLVTLGYCLFRLWTGEILFGDLTFFLTQRNTLTSLFGSIMAMIPAMFNASISAHRIRELIGLPKEEHNSAAYEAIASVADGGLAIEAKNVTFAYEDSTGEWFSSDKITSDDYSEGKPVLENASFEARPGEIVAIVGESGSAKTTLFRLLLGLVKPDSGSVVMKSVLAGAMSGAEVSAEMNADLRRFISYVPQGNTLMMGTIADNLRLVKATATDEEIIEALKVACAWDFVEPLGLDYKIGERGKGLSEGQAQRISIARAILRDTPILFLDEATSALDEATEKTVIEGIIGVARKTGTCRKTIVISSHKPSVINRCDRVYRVIGKKTVDGTIKANQTC